MGKLSFCHWFPSLRIGDLSLDLYRSPASLSRHNESNLTIGFIPSHHLLPAQTIYQRITQADGWA